MKRSRKVSLLLMGASAVTLTACGEDEVPVEAYKSVDQCIAEGKYSEDYCKGEWQKAEKLHEESAPRYSDRRACEEQYGFQNCYQPSSGSGSFFVPFMAGYLLGDILNRNNSFVSQPYYGNAYAGGYTTLGNQPVYRSGGKIVTTPKASQTSFKPAKVRTKTVARSGFGSRSFSKGWGG